MPDIGERTHPEVSARQIEVVVQSLEGRLGAAVDSVRIRAEVEAQFAAYAHARVRDFVPILVEIQVRSRLLEDRRGV